MNKCETCPVRCGECIAQKTNHKAYCDKTNPGHPQHSHKYIDLILHLSCGNHYPSGTYITVEKIEAEEKRDYPGLLQQGKNFFNSMKNFVKSGMEVADEETYNRRLAICGDCPSYDKKAGRCKECGCFMAAKAKIAVEKCPLDKWEKPADQINDPQANYDFSTIVQPTDCGCQQSSSSS